MMFSKRLQIEDGLNPVFSELQKTRLSGKDIIDLTVSNPTLTGIAYPEILLQTDFSLKSYQADAKGDLTAREEIANYYNRIYTPEQIVLSSGTSEAYSWLMKLLCDPGDEILIPSPSYPLFEMIADLECVKSTYYLIQKNAVSWKIDTESIIKSITAKTRMIILVNPNNPTGMVIAKNDFQEILDISRRYSIPLVIDEVFSDYIHQGEYFRPRAEETPVFILNGISKTLGLPQMKLSWIIVDSENPKYMERLEIIADTYLSVNLPVQKSLMYMFSMKEIIQQNINKRISENLKFIQSLKRKELETPQAGWNCLLKLEITNEEDWIMQKIRDGVYAYPGYMFNFAEPGFFSASLLLEAEKFATGINRLLN